MHVLFGGMGGQVNVASQLARSMARVGLRSGAVLYAPPGHHLPDGELAGVFESTLVVEKHRKVDVRGASRIGTQVRHWRPQAVIWHSPYAPVALARARRSGGTRSLVLVEHQTLVGRSRGNNLRSLLGLSVADAVVMLSEDYWHRYPFARRRLRALRHQAVIPNGVDLDLYTPKPKADRSGPLRVGMLGRMIPGKDFVSLLQAWKLVVEMWPAGPPELRLAGEGPERARVEATIASLGLSGSVEVCGRLSEEDVPEFLRSLDVYVHASQGETLSTSLLQAYATGLPVVASRVSGIETFVREGVDGYLVNTDDPIAFSEAIHVVLSDTDVCARLGTAARRRAEETFGVERAVAGYLELLRHLEPGGPWATALDAIGAEPLHLIEGDT